jgi:hypothetical protein
VIVIIGLAIWFFATRGGDGTPTPGPTVGTPTLTPAPSGATSSLTGAPATTGTTGTSG